VGGMAKALRTIPVILKVAADMRDWRPAGCWSLHQSGRPGHRALNRHAAGRAGGGPVQRADHDQDGDFAVSWKSARVKIAPERAELQTLA